MIDQHVGIPLAPWNQAPLLDHAGHARDTDTLELMWNDPKARLLVVNDRSEFRLDPFGDQPSGARTGSVFLGFGGQVPWFARRGDVTDPVNLRDHRLVPLHYQIASSAIAVMNWADRSKHCSRCGASLVIDEHGFSARCRQCNAEEFPRTDPAVIVAVLDPDDRIFLAHQRTWLPNRASILAGFVEAGESAENALYREVFEESQLVVDSCRYLGSQPWPFPRSLMLGYVARTHSTGRVDRYELEWGNFYSRDAVESSLESGDLILPEPGSIAHTIISAWREDRLPAPEDAWLS